MKFSSSERQKKNRNAHGTFCVIKFLGCVQFVFKLKRHEYQNLQTFLFPCKNNTISGYIQTTLSISLKVGHVEIKKVIMIVFSITWEWTLKTLLQRKVI